MFKKKILLLLLLSHGRKSHVGIEPIASDREAAPLTARPSLLSTKARAKMRLLFFSSIADQSEHSAISRDGFHWIIHNRKQIAQNEVPFPFFSQMFSL